MKYLFLILASFFTLFLNAQIDSLHAKSAIDNVTVFFTGAQVERSIESSIPKGKRIILLDSLPVEINPQSIQVKPVGQLKILSVKHRFMFPNTRKSKEVKSIETTIDNELLKVDQIRNEMSALSNEERILLQNSQLGSNAKGTTVEELKAAGDFYRSRLKEIGMLHIELKQKADKINDGIQDLYTEIGKLTINSQRTYSQIVVAVENTTGGNEKMKVSYYVPSAAWEPQYDFRIQTTKEPANLIYNAKVYQSSGEDWLKAKVILSSKNPSLSNEKPLLNSWYVDKAPRANTYVAASDIGSSGSLRGKLTDNDNGEALPFVNVVLLQDGNVVMGVATDFDGNYTIKPIPAGTYDVKVSSVGYNARSVEGVVIKSSRITYLNIELNSGVSLEAVEIVKYSLPLIDKDYTASGESFSIPSRSARKIAATSAGVSTEGSDGDISIRGSRTGGDFVYIDGVKVRGSDNLPKSAIQEVSVITGGLPASYGDSYSGVSNSYAANRYTSRGSSQSSTSSSSEGLLNALNVGQDGKAKTLSMEYEIEIPYSILSDGKDNILKIKEENVPVNYVYEALPKLDNDVFLSAQIENWNQLNLLTGPVSIYLKGTFTGETFIDANQTSDTLNLSISREQGILVKRNVNKDLNDKRFIGSNIKETLVWNLTVKNNKDEVATVLLYDQYPLSERASIEVELLNVANAKVDDKKGSLVWEMVLQPGESKDLIYSYTIKYPKYQRLYGN